MENGMNRGVRFAGVIGAMLFAAAVAGFGAARSVDEAELRLALAPEH